MATSHQCAVDLTQIEQPHALPIERHLRVGNVLLRNAVDDVGGSQHGRLKRLFHDQFFRCSQVLHARPHLSPRLGCLSRCFPPADQPMHIGRGQPRMGRNVHRAPPRGLGLNACRARTDESCAIDPAACIAAPTRKRARRRFGASAMSTSTGRRRHGCLGRSPSGMVVA